MKRVAHRVLFTGLTTVILVFFSEKVYWYVQGYAYAELVLYYAFPVYACLWAIDHFRVRRLPALVLVAALYAFLIEGVLTPVMYEAGLFDPIMPAYFIGWHGLFSVLFGWYTVRRWLVRGDWGRILVLGLIFGLLWGAWSLTYWLPETAGEVNHSAMWPVLDFGLYALFFTATLAVGHRLLGRGAWLREFKPTGVEKGLLVFVLLALFAVIVLPVLPFATFKLLALLTILFLLLRANRSMEQEGSVLSELAGPVKTHHVLALLAMPVAATGVYALAVAYRPPEEWIRFWLLESISILQALVGGGLFVWAVLAILWRSRTKRKGM